MVYKSKISLLLLVWIGGYVAPNLHIPFSTFQMCSLPIPWVMLRPHTIRRSSHHSILIFFLALLFVHRDLSTFWNLLVILCVVDDEILTVSTILHQGTSFWCELVNLSTSYLLKNIHFIPSYDPYLLPVNLIRCCFLSLVPYIVFFRCVAAMKFFIFYKDETFFFTHKMLGLF